MSSTPAWPCWVTGPMGFSPLNHQCPEVSGGQYPLRSVIRPTVLQQCLWWFSGIWASCMKHPCEIRYIAEIVHDRGQKRLFENEGGASIPCDHWHLGGGGNGQAPLVNAAHAISTKLPHPIMIPQAFLDAIHLYFCSVVSSYLLYVLPFKTELLLQCQARVARKQCSVSKYITIAMCSKAVISLG